MKVHLGLILVQFAAIKLNAYVTDYSSGPFQENLLVFTMVFLKLQME
ncbi:hypothetical protein J517_3075 [Acinetobacter baumannii 118362]|nr:hypothetical protein J517_3075 [Acinetobacter baumannii 118362]